MIEAFFTSLFASMAHSGLKRMFRDNLGKKLTRAYDIWVQNVPRDLAFQPEALLSWTDQEAPPASYRVIQETLAAKRVPEEDAWTALFVERWQFVIAHNPNPKQPLFDPRREKEILPLFADLGHRLYLACYEDQKLFQTTMAQLAPSIAGSLTEIEKKQNRHTKLLEDVHRAVVDREHHPENHPPRPVPTLGEMKTAKQAVKEEIEVSEPQPVYRDQGIREISQALEDAERQLEQASIEGRSTIEIRESILDLRRRLREGGRRQPGEILDDRYKLIDVLGKGGFAEVWKAWDRTKRRLVAVKIMHGQFTGDKTRKERFFRGARKMRELRHPAVVDVFDEQCEDEGFPFFVMAYQAGGNLHDRVLQGKLDEAAVLAVIRTIGEALVYAHQHDLVHRDIKPGNILLDGQGRACLTDFDLVKAADSTGGTRTRTGLGTFVYAAPELMAEAKDAGVAADIYGLGMTTLFALYGKDLPYEVVRDPTRLIEPLACAPHLKKAITKATAWSLEERFPTVEAFLAALEPSEPYQISRADRALSSSFEPGDDWVYIPPGEFTMGDDQSKYDDEKPAHRVRITEAFWLGRYPVTNREFRLFREAGGYKEQRFGTDKGWDRLQSEGWDKPAGWEHTDFNGDEQPVVGVGWFEASAYCKWLTETMALPEGFSLMLPTEAQWEWAARGSENRPYPWGTQKPSKELANFGRTVGKTTDVGSYPQGATPEGVQDMAGNVWEWCRDYWSERAYQQRQSITEDPYHQEGNAAVRALRGGAWLNGADYLRASNRSRSHVWFRFDSIGFRCCLCRRPEHG